ncbi:Uncharacterised protein [Klebsiella pneumoniae]|nr:Uncharacterised protein [Klebsiella pneumoniae]
MVRVHPGGGFRLQHRLEGAETIADIVHIHRSAGIDHVNTGRAVGLHLQGLLRQLLRSGHMAHHQKAYGVHAQFAGKGDMLRGNIRLGAVGRHPHYPRSGLIGVFQIVQRADAGQQ